MNMHSPVCTVADRAAQLDHSNNRIQKKSASARRAVRAAAKGFPAILHLAEAWSNAEVGENRLSIAQNTAELIGDEEMIEAADAAWQPALQRIEAAALAILNQPVTSPAEAVAKYKVFDATKAIYPAGEDEDEIAALKRDLQSLNRPSPTPVAAEGGPLPHNHPWAIALKTVQDLEASRDILDGEASDAACDAVADAEVALIRTPAPDASAVAEKIRRMAFAMEPGGHEFGPEMANEWLHGPADWESRCVGAVYLDLLRLGSTAPQDGANCRAAAVGAKIEAVLDREFAADEASPLARRSGDEAEYRRQDDLRVALADSRHSIEAELADAPATTLRGVAMQLAVAMHAAELVRGCSQQEDRDHFHTQVERLLTSALNVLSDYVSPRVWEAYVGGSHPAASNDQPTAHIPDAWERARRSFLTAQARWVALGDADTVESEEAFTSQLAALITYAQTPPPSLLALSTMMRDVIDFDALPTADDQADKRESIQALLDDQEAPINYLGMVFQHVTRLVGDVSEIHEARRAIPSKRGETDAEFMARTQSAAA